MFIKFGVQMFYTSKMLNIFNKPGVAMAVLHTFLFHWIIQLLILFLQIFKTY